jgi:hypothetical protein
VEWDFFWYIIAKIVRRQKLFASKKLTKKDAKKLVDVQQSLRFFNPLTKRQHMSQPTQGFRQPYNPQGNYEEYNPENLNKTQYPPQKEFRSEGSLPPNVPSNPLSQFLADFLQSVVDLSTEVGSQLYTNSSVIVIAAGLAGGVHHFASQHSSLANAALDASFHGSVAVAKYVGLSFFIKTALTPIHEGFTKAREEYASSYQKSKPETVVNEKTLEKRKALINSRVISYLTPMALAWIVAYTRGIPVKLGLATVYTMETFGLMKLLGMGYDYALAKYEKRRLGEGYYNY